MTNRQIKEELNKLEEKYNIPYGEFIENYLEKLSIEDKLLLEELSIRKDMNYCVVYDKDYFDHCSEDWYVNRRIPDDFDWDRLELCGCKDGRQRCKELWNEQLQLTEEQRKEMLDDIQESMNFINNLN